MIVKSVHGPVDLSKPENVVRGMVFRNGSVQMTAVAKRGTPNLWTGIDGVTFFSPSVGWPFVGCDPEYATRGDCERFALAPDVDAGAHGFARTRDGFAVDVYGACAGAVWDRFGDRRVNPPAIAPGVDRFIGLDRRRARPEDVERLCCGSRSGADGVPTVGPTGASIVVQAPRCSLAIGDHAEHEDLASGVKWPATAAPKQAGAMWTYPDAGAVVGVDRAMVPAPTLRALLQEFEGQQRGERDRHARGVRVLAYVETKQRERDLAKHLQTLGGTWHSGQRRVRWPGGSSLYMMGRDDEGRVRGARVDAIVGNWPYHDSARATLDPWGLRLQVSGGAAPAFWGEERRPDNRVSALRIGMADMPKGKMVMAGTPRRTSPDLLYADAVGGVQIGGARADFVAVDEAPIDPRRTAWLNDVTRRMLETRKAAASETATKRNAEALLLSKALRSALADVDRLPWDLADRKPIRAAAHALCEMAEAATDGMGHDGPKLRPMLGEMLGILRAAAHLPPATAASMAERTLGAARKAMPGRRA